MKNPKLIVKPFAKNGQKNVIPENYETSMESNQATWDQGFGQITMLPVAAGGLPPKGQDFNGIFNQISENIVYLSQGGRFKFSAEYAEAIGGYPKGAILQSDDEKKEYLSLIDNNKVDFNTATDISASWKLVNTDDLLAQIASKQPKGDYATKTELNSGLAGKQPTGDYATKKEVNSKLAKDQNGADIPDKAAFISNLGLGDAAKSNVVQATGDSITDVMSQRTVTFHLSNKATKDDLLTKMDIGYMGWGGKGEAYSPAYVDYVNDLKNADTPTKVMRSDSVTSNAHFKYGTVAYFKSRETFMAVTAAYDGEGVRVLAGNPNTLSIYNLADTKNVIGIGQTWQNMTASRAIGTTYTNATTKPIMISVTKLGRAATTLYINNQVVSSVDYGDGNLQGSLSTIIPAGSTYKIEVYSGTIQGWWELR
ncbi:TPA: hypothetical protein RG711_003306 [Morganella morganii subsp. morganii]|nr:hypothetical protein [Morganella morganii subsp. morganii]